MSCFDPNRKLLCQPLSEAQVARETQPRTLEHAAHPERMSFLEASKKDAPDAQTLFPRKLRGGVSE